VWVSCAVLREHGQHVLLILLIVAERGQRHHMLGVYLVAITLLCAEKDVPPALRRMMSDFFNLLPVMGHRIVGATSCFRQLSRITSPELRATDVSRGQAQQQRRVAIMNSLLLRTVATAQPFGV